MIMICGWMLLCVLTTPPSMSTAAQWNVDGQVREATVFLPVDRQQPAPVVFGFHGHGGTANNAARQFRMHQLWPEAIVVYPQGLPTPGRLTDPEGKRSGWQHDQGDQGDRDLKFFDAIMEWLPQQCAVDRQRVYSLGHSNGGGFTYLLWATRGDRLAAVAPSSSAWRHVERLSPKPAMHIAGKNDPLVKFAWQQLTLDALRNINQCEAESEEWAHYARKYPSHVDAPVITVIHPGTHKYYEQAPELIVRFFKEQVRPAATTPHEH